MIYRKESKDPITSIGALLIMVAFMIGLFIVARFVFRILAFLSPALLIAALILDYRTVVGYGRWLVNLLRRNLLMGVGAILLTVVGFPLVAAFLAGKALLMRNTRAAKKDRETRLEGEFVEFEEIDDEIVELPRLREKSRPESRERPPADRTSEPRKADDEAKYDRFFDEN